MFDLLKSKLSHMGQLDDSIKTIYIYRYISLMLISAFFLFFGGNSTFLLKIIIVACLTITSVIQNGLYINVNNSKRSILFLVFIETIGNILVMIPTGGLKSPYIWYAINTVLITLIFLNIKYCIVNLLIYLFSSIWLPPLFGQNKGINSNVLIMDYSNMLLGLILATVVGALLLQTQRELKRKKRNLICANNELSSLNTRLNELIVHIISLYQTVYTLSNESDRGRIIELLLSYTHNMMKPELVFFCELYDSDKWKVLIRKCCDTSVEKKIEELFEENLDSIVSSNACIDFRIDNMKIIVKCVKSGYSTYGAIGIRINEPDLSIPNEEFKQQLSFLAAVGAMALERVDLERANRRFLINEEQNRIANEIHDSVCQRLFAASCSIQALMHRTKGKVLPELELELDTLQESIQSANRELRKTIYAMSWRKDGINAFYEDISKYINEISRLYDKHIKLQLNGNQDLLSHNIKNILYRIICECVGNAMRHSGCNKVDINMNINLKNTSLIISDDGMGFDVKKSTIKNGGLGISNLYSLVHLYNGQIHIESIANKGTVIKIALPNCQFGKEEAV